MKQKEKCHHCKIPMYNLNEQSIADSLIKRIGGGDISAYSELTWLAVTVAETGRFRRETCDKCFPKGN